VYVYAYVYIRIYLCTCTCVCTCILVYMCIYLSSATMGWLWSVGSMKFKSILQNIVSFIGLFCNTTCHFIDPSNRSHPISPPRLRLVGSLKLYVSVENIGLFCRALLQRRPVFLRSLLIVANPYHHQRRRAADGEYENRHDVYTLVGVYVCMMYIRVYLYTCRWVCEYTKYLLTPRCCYNYYRIYI